MSEKNTAAQEPIIFLDDVRVTFTTRTGSLLHPNKVHAVQGVTLKLMPGETIGIVGESGCGKSTTANIMIGLQQPTSGKVYFKGEDVTKRTADERKKIGRVVSVVFQDPATALNPRMTVHDQLLDPLLVHKIGTPDQREANIRELINLVGLPPSALQALPGQLSGGQRQRVAIARALALGPDAINADSGSFGEPTFCLYSPVKPSLENGVLSVSVMSESGGKNHGNNVHFRHSGSTANFVWMDGHATAEHMAFRKNNSDPRIDAMKIGNIGAIDSDSYYTPMRTDLEAL